MKRFVFPVHDGLEFRGDFDRALDVHMKMGKVSKREVSTEKISDSIDPEGVD